MTCRMKSASREEAAFGPSRPTWLLTLLDFRHDRAFLSLTTVRLFTDQQGRRTRTPNRRFWRPVLYQLSYSPRSGHDVHPVGRLTPRYRGTKCTAGSGRPATPGLPADRMSQ